MATIQSTLGTYLRGYSGLAAIIGQRLYPVRPPDNAATPYAYYSVRGLERELPLVNPVLTESFVLEVYCASRSYDEAWSAARQVIDALNYYSATMGTTSDVNIVFLDAEDQEAADVGIFEVLGKFNVIYPLI